MKQEFIDAISEDGTLIENPKNVIIGLYKGYYIVLNKVSIKYFELSINASRNTRSLNETLDFLYKEVGSDRRVKECVYENCKIIISFKRKISLDEQIKEILDKVVEFLQESEMKTGCAFCGKDHNINAYSIKGDVQFLCEDCFERLYEFVYNKKRKTYKKNKNLIDMSKNYAKQTKSVKDADEESTNEEDEVTSKKKIKNESEKQKKDDLKDFEQSIANINKTRNAKRNVTKKIANDDVAQIEAINNQIEQEKKTTMSKRKRKAEELRREEEERIKEAARKLEEKRLQEEARKAEERRKAEEAERARIAEERRKAREAKKAEERRRKAEEERRKAEEARIAEEKRKLEEAREAERKRLEEARKAEERRKARERKKAEEERRKAEEARIAEEKRKAEAKEQFKIECKDIGMCSLVAFVGCMVGLFIWVLAYEVQIHSDEVDGVVEVAVLAIPAISLTLYNKYSGGNMDKVRLGIIVVMILGMVYFAFNLTVAINIRDIEIANKENISVITAYKSIYKVLANDTVNKSAYIKKLIGIYIWTILVTVTEIIVLNKNSKRDLT